jgi:hypothetical protein
MDQKHHIAAFIILTLVFLALTACEGMTATPSTELEGLLPMATQIGGPCEACVQATLAAAGTQQQLAADHQAAATAEVVRANALATVNSANATLSSAQTQSQNNANIIAAQMAGTAEVVRANAQATLNSAGATQNAAHTQDAIQQTQIADMATTSAGSVLAQQDRDHLAAGTQTAIADHIATQAQSAVATSQWYAGQERQREEERQAPMAFLWTWCPPIFLVVLAGLTLWGLGRWLGLQQANQRIPENPVARLPVAKIETHRHVDRPPYIEREAMHDGYQVTTPDDPVRRWLDEVKDELLRSDKDNEDDDTDN